MGFDGYKPCVIIMFVLLFAIGIGIYYRKEIGDYLGRSPKINYRTEIPVHAFVIKKYRSSSLFSPGQMKIYAANDPNETELYRIDWYQSKKMTLTRIKDKFIVSQAQHINRFSYSFKLFGQSITTGKMSPSKTNQPNFDIEYTTHIHKTSKLVLRNCKKQMMPFNKRINWMVEWFDMTQRFSMNRRRLNSEMLNPKERAYLAEKFVKNSYSFASPLNPYVYDLYVLKYLPDEFYLTTLIIADHGPHSEC
jgi:hypothetical protein